jgi:hypothetical protein
VRIRGLGKAHAARTHALVRPAVLAALAGLVLLVAGATPASAKVKTYTLRHGPVSMGGFRVKLPKVFVKTPRKTAFITKMSAELVDKRGRKVSLRDVMLHHVVFLNAGRRRGQKKTSCAGRSGQPFYGTGEETQRLLLPRGYGYHVNASDRWRMQAMLMSHRLRFRKVYVRYHVTIDTSKKLTPVVPYWLRANGCNLQPSYTVPGGGAPGSTNFRSFDWKIPISGRIVAAGGHLHGGAHDMWVSQPRCGNRFLYNNGPLFGHPNDLVYRVFPVLHEPGPVATGYFMSRTGIPVRAGETLRVNAVYDAEIPHPRVMAITHVYVARDRNVTAACAPRPKDAHTYWERRDGRRKPPRVIVPLTGLDKRGRPRIIDRPPGPVEPLPTGATVDLRSSVFAKPNIVLAQHSILRWRFADPFDHNITFANGPRAVGTPTLSHGKTYQWQFNVPGTYKLFCYLHPVTMHQVVDVKPLEPPPPPPAPEAAQPPPASEG